MKTPYNHGCERPIITVEKRLLGREWLYVGNLQLWSRPHGRKLKNTLPITTVVLNNRCEKFKGHEFDQTMLFLLFKQHFTTVLSFNRGDMLFWVYYKICGMLISSTSH